MKFKDFKLGVKLGIGFGVLILISMILGGMAIRNMSKITKESEDLANEYVPEIRIATDLRGAANRTMYEMRAYGYTEDEVFYKNALKEIEAIRKAISEGDELNNRAKNLKTLAQELKIAEEITNEYLELVEQTVEVNAVLANNRSTMDEEAAAYLANCAKYLDNQNRAMLREISSKSTSQERLTKITLINEIIDVGNEARIGNFKSQATRDPKIFQEALALFPTVYSLLEEIRGYSRLETDLRALDLINSEAMAYQHAMESFIENWLKREEIAKKRNDSGIELISACIATANAGLEGTQRIADDAIVTLKASSTTMVTGLFIALVMGIIFALFLTRGITKPVNLGVSFAKKLAEGDLTATIEVDQKDEIGELAEALAGMGKKLQQIVESILIGAENISSASLQMSSTSQEMSQGASEQASSVEEVSSSMEEMASTIQQNTDGAQTTEKMAISSAKGIKEGSEATNTAVEGMKNIAEKIRIINDIAFQTNILALNAAVEAARAGEHGKGFAVVAAEVRKLAERSKVAADEIDELSRNGVAVAENAGNKLNEIVPDIEKTAQLVQEIAASSMEQSTGADQVNAAVQQLNNVTQQNAAASEELATSAEELASQAEQLKDTIQFFNIGKNQNYKAKQSISSKSKTRTSNREKQTSKPVNLELANADEVHADQDFESF